MRELATYNYSSIIAKGTCTNIQCSLPTQTNKINCFATVSRAGKVLHEIKVPDISGLCVQGAVAAHCMIRARSKAARTVIEMLPPLAEDFVADFVASW